MTPRKKKKKKTKKNLLFNFYFIKVFYISSFKVKEEKEEIN